MEATQPDPLTRSEVRGHYDHVHVQVAEEGMPTANRPVAQGPQFDYRYGPTRAEVREIVKAEIAGAIRDLRLALVGS